MTLIGRSFLFVTALAAIVVTGSALGMASAGFGTGVATVRVAESSPDGVNLYIPVPAAMIDLALRAGLRFAPEEALADVRREIEPWAPTLEAVAKSIEDSPDTVFVRVLDGSDRVTVSKKGRKLLVEVDSLDASVRVSLPASLLTRGIEALGSNSP